MRYGGTRRVPGGSVVGRTSAYARRGALLLMVGWTRYRVEAMATPGVASQDPADGEPSTAPGPVGLDRLTRVLGTGRCVPTRRQRPRRNGPLVEPDHSDQDASEHSASTASPTSRASSSNPAPYAGCRARISTSAKQPAPSNPGSTRRRPISRSLRFTRFRSTMSCPSLPTIRPSRERETGEGAKKTSTVVVLFRFPRCRSARISWVRRIRTDRGRRSPGSGAGGITSRRRTP